MMRFGPPLGTPSREVALANPRTAAVYETIRALGEASAQQVVVAVKTSMRTSSSETAEKLAHLKRAGLLKVRRTDLQSSDPYSYNLYSLALEHNGSAAPRAEEGPHGEGPVGAVCAGDGVYVVQRRGH